MQLDTGILEQGRKSDIVEMPVNVHILKARVTFQDYGIGGQIQPPSFGLCHYSLRPISSFMISFVPPKMRVTRAPRQARAIAYSFM